MFDFISPEASPDWLFALLTKALASDPDSPHVVVCTDPRTDYLGITGPYPSALAAAVAAEEEERLRGADEEPLHYQVMPLMRPPSTRSDDR